MFISHKYKVIFVHIQKTGGTSIRKLFKALDPNLVEKIELDPSRKRFKHCFASDIQSAVDEQTFAQYTKFAVVRHPFDRMLSWYYMLKYGTFKTVRVVRQDGSDLGDRLIVEIDRRVNSFNEFLMLPRNDESGLFERFYVNQLAYLTGEDGQLLVDRVIRFENLRDDFAELAQAVGLESTLPHTNKTTFQRPKEAYYDEQSRQLIRARFEKDFDYFGFE